MKEKIGLDRALRFIAPANFAFRDVVGGFRVADCMNSRCSSEQCKIQIHARSLEWSTSHCKQRGVGMESLISFMHRIDGKAAKQILTGLFGSLELPAPDQAYIRERDKQHAESIERNRRNAEAVARQLQAEADEAEAVAKAARARAQAVA